MYESQYHLEDLRTTANISQIQDLIYRLHSMGFITQGEVAWQMASLLARYTGSEVKLKVGRNYEIVSK